MSLSHIPPSDPYSLEINKHVIFQENKCKAYHKHRSGNGVEHCCQIFQTPLKEEGKLKGKKAVVGSISPHSAPSGPWPPHSQGF